MALDSAIVGCLSASPVSFTQTHPVALRVASAPVQIITPERAAGFVTSGMWLDYGAALCQPDVFDRVLGARIHEVSNIKLRHCLTMRPRAVMEADPDGHHIYSFSLHYSSYDRKKHDEGRCNYIPVNLGEIPDYYRRFMCPADIVILKTCPLDGNGYYNLSAANLWHHAIIERARIVIVETSRGLPYVHGEQTGLHVSEVDYVMEGDDAPAPELPNPPIREADVAVGRLIASEIEDGDCLQIGIGGMPNAVCALLLQSGVRDLGVHTEMMIDGVADLYKAGRISGARKRLNPGKLVYSFALGSRDLYATLDGNHDMHCCPVDYTNAPDVIMQNEHVVSINNTTQVDLQGQAASESDGHRHISGTGGQLQFVRGAYASKGGKSFICLTSTYEKRGERRSRIVLSLTQGNVVTTPRSDVMFVVTEFGIVNLKGKSIAERARALIGIAHPDFRDGLERQAYEHRLIPRGVSF